MFKALERIFHYAVYLFMRARLYMAGGKRGSVLTHILGTWLIIELSFNVLFFYAFVSVTIRDICMIRNITFRIFAVERTRVQGDGYASTLRKNILIFNKYLFEYSVN